MQSLADTWQTAFAPRDRRPTREWASEHVILGSPITKSGPFSSAESRYLEAPIDALDNDRVRQVNVRAPVRSGKSLMVDVWIPEIVTRRPGPTMWVMEKDDMATEHSEARVLPLLRRCAPSAKYLPSDPRKVTPTDIIFTHGMPFYVRGPSLSNLQAKGIQYMALDEVWRYKPGVIGEAKGRLGDYEKLETSKLAILSQGGDEDSDWAVEFDKGVIHTWHVPCLACGELMPLDWDVKRADHSRAGMRWDEHKDEDGFWIVAKCLPSIRYECPACGHPHTSSNRTLSEWNRRGEYVKTNTDKNPKIESYQWNAIVTRKWVELVGEFLDASNAAKRGGWLPMVTFWQKRMARNKSESSFVLSRAAEIRKVEYKASEQWPDEQYRAMTVDCQKDFEDFWLVVRAWGKDIESRLLCWRRVRSWEEIEAVQKEFDVDSHAVFVDVAYTHSVAIKEVGKRDWTGLWGHDTALFTHTNGKQSFQRIYSPQKPATPGPGDGVWFHWARPTVSDFFDQLKRGLAGKWAADVNVGQTYIDQLNAQYKKPLPVKSTGMTQWKWALRKHGMDDHLLDCERMQVVAASMAGVLDDTIFAAPEQPEEKAQ
jgi:hypothetical protein